mmetsp:Transcript_1419/g.3368  ORF Transcript_1419/g.3368 Transcript_1419/m.3368 type:complete len:223 (+) Transcript_1419:344-1012(+)
MARAIASSTSMYMRWASSSNCGLAKSASRSSPCMSGPNRRKARLQAFCTAALSSLRCMTSAGSEVQICSKKTSRAPPAPKRAMVPKSSMEAARSSGLGFSKAGRMRWMMLMRIGPTWWSCTSSKTLLRPHMLSSAMDSSASSMCEVSASTTVGANWFTGSAPLLAMLPRPRNAAILSCASTRQVSSAFSRCCSSSLSACTWFMNSAKESAVTSRWPAKLPFR